MIAGAGWAKAPTHPASTALQANPAESIPWAELGSRAGAHYQGEGLSVRATAEGAVLRCDFQKLEGRVDAQGLWLTSTASEGRTETFRVRAHAVGREGGTMQGLAETGAVAVAGKLARYTRPGLTEEYSVSVDGVRQDFLLAERPAGEGALRVSLGVDGTEVESAASGVRLRLPGSGRRLAYDRLRVEDATGRTLNARFEVEGPHSLRVWVEDAGATYPLRIDPTFSDEQWFSMGGLPGTDGEVHAAVTDEAGNLYIGGEFTVAGNVKVNGIAKWDGSQWSALGSGMIYSSFSDFAVRVYALAMHDGHLYAGGRFVMAGDVAANHIAKWDGSRWFALSSGMPGGKVYALAMHDGNLYAGGWFTAAGGVAANSIAKWDGSQWSALGSGMIYSSFMDSLGEVYALAMHDGHLYAGGRFVMAGDVAANHIAKWDGSRWSALGSGVKQIIIANAKVNALAVHNGHLYAGGTFITVGDVTANNIARWDGSQWFSLDSGVSGELPPPDFTSGIINAMIVHDRQLYVGGGFNTANETAANRIARWNGTEWSPLGTGTGVSGAITSSIIFDGQLYIGGRFATAGGVVINSIAKWDGNQWSSLGSGLVNSPGDSLGSVYALAMHNGELYAGGEFRWAGGVPARNIAKWDGRQWSDMGLDDPSNPSFFFILEPIRVLAIHDGDLYAGGKGGILKWDGSQWSTLGPGNQEGSTLIGSDISESVT